MTEERDMVESERCERLSREAEAAFKESEANYCVLLEDLPELICRSLPDLTCIYVNKSYCRYFGRSREELIGRSFLELLPEEDHKPIKEHLATLTPEEPVGTVEHRVFRHDGEVRWQQWTNRAVYDEQDILLGYQSVGRDFNVRRLAAEALKESEERFRSLADATFEGIVISEEGKILDTNYAFAEMFGYELAEVRGIEIAHFHAPEFRELVREKVSSGSDEPYESVGMRKDGTTFEVEVQGKTASYGERIVHVAAVRDITRRKEAERALKEERNLLRTVIDNVPDLVFAKDTEHRFVVNNEEHLFVLGAEGQEEAFGSTDEDFMPEDLTESYHADDRRVFKTGQPQIAKEEPVVVPSGERRWISTTKVPLRGEDDEVEGLVAISRDVTERRLAEEALRQSEERYRMLVELSPEAIAVHDGERLLYINPAGADLFGAQNPEELVGREVLGFVHPDYQELVAARIGRVLAEGQPSPLVEEKYLRLDGKILHLEVAGQSVTYEGNPAVQAVLRDVTERKQAEEALRESEQRLRTVAAGAPVVTFAFDSEGVFTFESGSALKDLGLEPGANVGRSVFEAYQGFPKVLENMRRALSGEEVIATVEIAGRAYHATYSPQRGEDGKVEGVIGVAVDITERRKLERELEHRATHDPLTDLPNRALFVDRLSQALARANRREEKVTVLFLDLDGFKAVNDQHGHRAGDGLLIEAGIRLLGCVRLGDTVARIGGDEFAVLIEGISDEAEAVRAAERILQEIKKPFVLPETAARLTTSIGIALGPSGGSSGEDDPNRLLTEADAAMYEAKRAGKARWEVSG